MGYPLMRVEAEGCCNASDTKKQRCSRLVCMSKCHQRLDHLSDSRQPDANDDDSLEGTAVAYNDTDTKIHYLPGWRGELNREAR